MNNLLLHKQTTNYSAWHNYASTEEHLISLTASNLPTSIECADAMKGVTPCFTLHSTIYTLSHDHSKSWSTTIPYESITLNHSENSQLPSQCHTQALYAFAWPALFLEWLHTGGPQKRTSGDSWNTFLRARCLSWHDTPAASQDWSELNALIPSENITTGLNPWSIDLFLHFACSLHSMIPASRQIRLILWPTLPSK